MTYTHKTSIYALYLAAIVLAAIFYLTLEGTDLFGGSNEARYGVNLACIVVTIAAVIVVVSWEKFGFVARRLQSPDESVAVWRISCVPAPLPLRSISMRWPIVWPPMPKTQNTVCSSRSCWAFSPSPSSIVTTKSDLPC